MSCMSCRCIDFAVAAPDLQFGGSTPADNTLVYSAVGCRLEICPTVQDMSGIYDVDVNPVAGTMPPGARFDVGCAAQAQSTSLHPLFPILAYPMRRTQSCTRCMHFEAVRGGETKNYTACFEAGDTNGMKTIRSGSTHVGAPHEILCSMLFTLCPKPCALHSIRSTLCSMLFTPYPKPCTLCPVLFTLYPKLCSQDVRSDTSAKVPELQP